MPQALKTVRVFISSTFRDMHAERDYLSRLVFPELRSRCVKRGADFIGLDLRWGVTEEEARQEGALAICLREIERCRPFFVCLLGSRFGWVPPPEEVPQDFFDRFSRDGAVPEELTAWYRLDPTSVPPVYRLRRDVKLPNDVAEQIAGFWESKGLPLAGESITSREIVRAVFESGYPPSHALFYLRRAGAERDARFPQRLLPVFTERDPSRRKKLAALKRKIRSKRDEVVVRGYRASYSGLRIDSSLIPAGLTQSDCDALRDGLIDPSEWAGLSEPVKRAIEERGTVALEGMEDLGRQVLDDLWSLIEQELEQPAEALDAHEQERAYHERFIRDRTRIFLGREDILDRMVEHVGDVSNQRPLVVTGNPGGGKSALMAKCAALLRVEMPDALVIPLFIGASPGSTNLDATLRSICETLKRECQLEDEIPADPEKLRPLFGVFLGKAGEKRDVVLVLDALNQLDPAGRSHELGWLPLTLSPRVKVIVSTLAGDCLDRLRRRLPDDHIIDVPTLERHHQETLVGRHLMPRRKRLSGAQLQSLLDTEKRPDVRLPLYLLVALEELSLFGDYEALTNRIENLPPRLPELFQQVLARLEQDHGREMTESICRWMAVSRSGMLESEILDLLRKGGEFPRAKWTRFYRALEFYLRPIGEEEGSSATGLLDFYHDQLRFAVYRRYLDMDLPGSEPTDNYRRSHRELAGYFRRIASYDGDLPRWHTDRPRGLSELPYHQTRGEKWEDLESTLCDLGFIEAKGAIGMTYGLVADYALGLALLPEGSHRMVGKPSDEIVNWTEQMISYANAWNDARARHRSDLAPLPNRRAIPLPKVLRSARVWSEEEIQQDRVKRAGRKTRLDRIDAFSRFVTSEAHTLGAYAHESGFCARQAYNCVADGPVGEAADQALAAMDPGEFALLRLSPTRPPYSPRSALLRTLKHEMGIHSLAMTPDGRRAVTADFSGDLQVWDLEKGECTKTLKGHGRSSSSQGCAVAISADGRTAISGGDDKTVRVWDTDSGQTLHTLEACNSKVTGLAITPDSRLAVIAIGEASHSLTAWDIDSCEHRQTERGHGFSHTVALTPCGNLAVSGGQIGGVDVWDIGSGRCLRSLGDSWWLDQGPVAMSADGRVLVSGSPLRAWDIERGRCLKEFEKTGQVVAVAITPDGKLAVSGSTDRLLRVWDVASGRCLKVLQGHSSEVRGVALTADGRQAVSGSLDGTLCVWDIEKGECRTSEGHSGQAGPWMSYAGGVTSVALTPGNRSAVSAAPDGTMRLWQTENGKVLKTHSGAYNLALTPDGTAAVSSDNYSLFAWDVESGRQIELQRGGFVTHQLDNSHGYGHELLITPDGKAVIAGSRSHQVRTWKMDSGEVLSTLSSDSKWSTVNAVTPDGRWALIKKPESKVMFADLELGTWDLATGEYRRIPGARATSYTCVGLVADGQQVFSVRDNSVRIFDIESGECSRVHEWNWLRCMALAPDGRHAVTGHQDRTLRVWDLATGERRAMTAPGFEVTALSVRGNIVAAGDASGGVLFYSYWDAGAPIVTAVRLFDHDTGGWESEIIAMCEWCCERFTASPSILDTIQGIERNADISRDGSPCLELPLEAWKEPRLLLECPQCRQLLRFNPFIVDNRERAPIKAVRPTSPRSKRKVVSPQTDIVASEPVVETPLPRSSSAVAFAFRIALTVLGAAICLYAAYWWGSYIFRYAIERGWSPPGAYIGSAINFLTVLITAGILVGWLYDRVFDSLSRLGIFGRHRPK